jgi:2-polyprenyl-3-methyl-5-hydroxy-6-metoxy-1,4-benzoquinol methylase
MSLYSNKYVEELKWLHSRQDRPRGFGGKIKPLGAFYTFYEKWKPLSVLDYGCGKGAILEHLKKSLPNTTWHGYDPAVNEYKNIIEKEYDCVFSNDVLEHIEPEYLDNVLDHIWQLSRKSIWLRIDTRPARKVLKDGRNAHLILEDKDWWENKLRERTGKIVYIELGKKGKLDVAIER